MSKFLNVMNQNLINNGIALTNSIFTLTSIFFTIVSVIVTLRNKEDMLNFVKNHINSISAKKKCPFPCFF